MCLHIHAGRQTVSMQQYIIHDQMNDKKITIENNISRWTQKEVKRTVTPRAKYFSCRFKSHIHLSSILDRWHMSENIKCYYSDTFHHKRNKTSSVMCEFKKQFSVAAFNRPCLPLGNAKFSSNIPLPIPMMQTYSFIWMLFLLSKKLRNTHVSIHNHHSYLHTNYN